MFENLHKYLVGAGARDTARLKKGERSLCTADREQHRMAFEPHHSAGRKVCDKSTAHTDQRVQVGHIGGDTREHLSTFGAKINLQFEQFFGTINMLYSYNLADADFDLFKIINGYLFHLFYSTLGRNFLRSKYCCKISAAAEASLSTDPPTQSPRLSCHCREAKALVINSGTNTTV